MICLPPSRRPLAVGAILATALVFASASVRASSPDELLKDGDNHDVRLEAADALESYLKLEQLEPNNADLMVRIARQYRHLMADASSNSEKVKLGEKALEYGRKAAQLGPNNSDAQLSCAISYGKMLPLRSSKEQVTCSKLIKDGAEKAIKLNANNDLAWHILGRWHRAVSSVGTVKRALASMIYDKLPEASAEESAECLEMAVKLNPNRVMHQIELGKTYAQLGRTNEAKQHLMKGLAMPSTEKDDASLKASGREVLRSLD